ncbi:MULTISPECIES: RIP metalloprotease [Corynebacterium]|uniref:M50 family metallopeptidase n=1 Tax=Corynebacterium TaxID=1716 RepID=UPI00124D8B2F|nr:MULTISPECIES: M50 family metallopeptidase [Corynebacterium]
MVSYTMGVVLFALGIAITIALHELGHLLAARACGMRVRRYFIGFGPTLFSFRKGHTEYGLKAIPLGGFCDIAGMTSVDPVTEDERPYAMVYKPWYQRVFVLLGGVLMNLALGLLTLYLVAATAGLPNPDPDLSARVGEVREGPAAVAGVRPGDTIRAIDGQPMATFTDVRDYVVQRPGEEITVQVERDHRPVDLDVRVDSRTVEGQEMGVIGVVNAPIPDLYLSYGPLEAVPATLHYSGAMLHATWQGVASLPAKLPGVARSIFGAEREMDSPMSVVGASLVGGELVERSQWSIFAMMLASLNFFLALFNLLPFVPLDGGHIVIVFYEKLRDAIRRMRGLAPAGPANYAALMPLIVVMWALLMGIGVLIIAADVVNPVRLFG